MDRETSERKEQAEALRDLFDEIGHKAKGLRLDEKLGLAEDLKYVFDEIGGRAEGLKLAEKLGHAEELKGLLDEIGGKTEGLDLEDKLAHAEELNDLLDAIEEKLEAIGGGKNSSLTVLTPDRKRIARCTQFSCQEHKDGRVSLCGGNNSNNSTLAWYPDAASAQAELKNLFDAMKKGLGFYEMQ